MTKDVDQIRAAIAAIEAGAPDDKINRLCALAFGWERHKEGRLMMWHKPGTMRHRFEPPFYTTRLDAIMAEKPNRWYTRGDAPTECRTRLLALLRAMEAQTK